MIDKHITDVMNEEERIVFELRSLYGRYGYKPYRMSKFEEYDLYAKNKDFLISEDVIAFTDKSGRLMALKPDVTISIVKGSRYAQRSVEKLCYNENVYRVSKGGDTFSEIMQAGLECIGDIDTYCVGEVLSLAASSLDLISHDFILDVSHIGLLLTAVNSLGLASEAARAVYMLAASKNVHELAAVCREGGVPDDKTAALCELLSIYGRADDVLPDVRRLSGVFGAEAECNELASSVGMLTTSSLRERVKIDFSVVSDAGYYTGVVFKGFINGVPEAVLSGGRYDGLLRKMKRRGGAAGFAVYLDTLEALDRADRMSSGYEVDTVLLYEDGDDPIKVSEAVMSLTSSGVSVLARRGSDAGGVRCRRVTTLKESEADGN